MDVIERAISERRTLRFWYDGMARVVIPVTYGISTRGIVMLRAYLVGGGTRSSTTVLWRSFKLQEVQSQIALGDEFNSGPPGYRRSGRGFTRIFCQL